MPNEMRVDLKALVRAVDEGEVLPDQIGRWLEFQFPAHKGQERRRIAS
jgi:hypothetical protein